MHGHEITVGPMRVDVMTTALPLREIGRFASRTADVGFDGMLLTESGRTPYTAAAVAAIAAPGLELSTGVAVAFPRSPMVTAQNAWELQEATGRKVPARASARRCARTSSVGTASSSSVPGPGCATTSWR